MFNQEQSKYDELIVIGGDTVVYLENNILGKPRNENDAREMLQNLQGKTNEVYSSFAVIVKRQDDVQKEIQSSSTLVKMKSMSETDIEEYINTGEPLDKAGSYAIQGIRF